MAEKQRSTPSAGFRRTAQTRKTGGLPRCCNMLAAQYHLPNRVYTMLRCFDPPDARRIAEAWEYAIAAHHGQRRKISGRPFVVHPAGVAAILAAAGFGADVVIAGLLHDAVEDGAATRVDIENRFGNVVWLLVAGVTN